MDPHVPQDELTPIENAILAGRKIEAIKLYRAATHCGLGEAKGAVDELEARLHEEAPERFATDPSKNGCTVTIGGCIALAASAWMLLR